MEEKELIEPIIFPIKHLEIGMIDYRELGIDGVTYNTLRVGIEVYDCDTVCNHYKYFKTNDRFRGTMEDNIKTCVKELIEQKVFKDGIDYELFFGENQDCQPITCTVYNNEIGEIKNVERPYI